MAVSLDPTVLLVLTENVRREQTALDRYIRTGVAPPSATPITDPDLVPLALAQKLVPAWSLSTLRREVKKHHELGDMIGKRQQVYLTRLRQHLAARGCGS
jgi:hypothetical protein